MKYISNELQLNLKAEQNWKKDIGDHLSCNNSVCFLAYRVSLFH